MKSDCLHIPADFFSTRKFLSFLVFGFLWTFSLQANGFMSLDDELEIYGSKEIQINNYSYQGDFNQFVQRNPQVLSDRKFDQHTRFQVRGRLGESTEVNAIFDDSNEREEDEKILLNLRGSQYEAALGRIDLNLEGTRFLINNKKALGAFFQRNWNHWKAAFLISRSEGIEEREQFFGRGLQREYILKKSPVVAGSESITLDGEKLNRGVDYRIDYEGGSVQLEHKLLPVESTSNLIVEYESSRDGSSYKNRVFGSRLSYDFNKNRKVGLSLLMEKDQIDEAMMRTVDAKPHQLNLYGLDLKWSDIYGLDLDMEFVYSRDKQDIASHTLPILSGTALDIAAKYKKLAHKLVFQKERIDPRFRSIGKNKFIALGEDANLVGDVDQSSLRYQYTTGAWSYSQEYRDSETNLKDDPGKDSVNFMMVGGSLSYEFDNGLRLRTQYKNENKPSLRNGILRTENILRKKSWQLNMPVKSWFDLDLQRLNEKKTINNFSSGGGNQNLFYQTNQFSLSSKTLKNFNVNYNYRLRNSDNLLLGVNSEENTNHSLKFNVRKGRELQSQLEFAWRKDENNIKSEVNKALSSGMDFSYRKSRDLNYRMKLKHELKTRIVQELPNLDLSQVRDRDQKTYITPTYPVQTFQNSQQLRFRHNEHFYHRLSYRFRSEEEDNINRLLSKNENMSWDFKWNLPKDYRLRYKWSKRDRYNLNSNIDRNILGFDTELTRALGSQMTLTSRHYQEVENDYIKGNYQELFDRSIRFDRSLSRLWQFQSNLLWRDRRGIEEREEWSFGGGAVYTPNNSSMRIGLDMSRGRSKDRRTHKTGDLMSLKLNINQRLFTDTHLEGNYKFEKDGPSSEGSGYSANMINLRVSVDF